MEEQHYLEAYGKRNFRIKTMKLEKIQFITHQNSKYNYLDSAMLALENGIRFIQLRMKNSKHEEVIKVGKV